MSTDNPLRDDGFVLASSNLDEQTSIQWVARIEESLPNFADEVGCTLDEYLLSVSAWSDKNPLVQELAEHIRCDVASVVEKITGERIELLESKLLMKGENCPWATHAHQDVAYRSQNRRRQYQYSTWISLSHIGPMQAPLEFLPKSQLEPISEFQDFLNPGFVDRRESNEWKQKKQSIEMIPGEMVIFDSRVWHASSPWVSPPRRYAIVLRWAVSGIEPVEIPLPTGERRGMYEFSGWLDRSLRQLIGRKLRASESTLEVAIETGSLSADCKTLLRRYMINRTAGIKHGGSAQRGMLWDPLAKAIRAELEMRGMDIEGHHE